VSTDFLRKEREHALADVTTPDCRMNGCGKCGVCDHKTITLRLQGEIRIDPIVDRRTCKDEDGLHRYHLVIAKTDNARFLSHLETVTAFQRAMRRAKLPLAYSHGYNPNPRISMPEALPLGIESRVEDMEVMLYSLIVPSVLCQQLNAELPAGLEAIEAKQLLKRTQPTASRRVTYEASLAGESWPDEGFRRFQQRVIKPFRRRSKRGETLILLEKRLLGLEALGSGRIRFTLTQSKNGSIRVRDLLMHIFDLSEEQILNARIMKVTSETIEG
jgi:radical SAM-linked protein